MASKYFCVISFSTISAENEENVVKLPKKPVINISLLASLSENPKQMPTIKQPSQLASSVPNADTDSMWLNHSVSCQRDNAPKHAPMHNNKGAETVFNICFD